jgi:hypothetical protein
MNLPVEERSEHRGEKIRRGRPAAYVAGNSGQRTTLGRGGGPFVSSGASLVQTQIPQNPGSGGRNRIMPKAGDRGRLGFRNGRARSMADRDEPAAEAAARTFKPLRMLGGT